MNLSILFSGFFTTLWSWKHEILTGLALWVDSIVFELLSYVYKLFMLVSQLNFNSLESIISPLTDRLKTVILVVIMFKAGIALIRMMVQPDEVKTSGPKLLKNIFIVGCMLICYNLVFSILNEVSLLIVGAPENYSFTTLSRIAGITQGDEGLINRFVFGGKHEGDMGDFIAVETLGIFLRDANDETQSNELKSIIADGDGYDFSKLTDIDKKVGKDVVYNPLISSLMGVYMIFCIGNIAIEIAIRMFKLLVLQLIAPMAIITKLDEKSTLFDKYVKLYISTYTSAFMRILSVLITNVFVSQFIINIDTFFDKKALESEGVLTKLLLIAIVVVGAYTFVKQLPGFLKEITGNDFNKDKSKGFSSIVGGALGFGAGTLVGGVAGAAKGGGLGGALKGAFAGGVDGARNGYRGNGIADRVRNLSSSFRGDVARAQTMGQARQARIQEENQRNEQISQNAIRESQDNEMARYNAAESAYNAYNTAKVDEIKDQSASGLAGFSGSGNVKYGTNREEYAKNMLKHNDRYNNAKARLAAAKGGFAAEGVRNAQNKFDHCARALQNAQASGVDVDKAQQNYDNAKSQLEAAKESVAKEIVAAEQEFDAARNEALSTASAEYDRALNSANGEAVVNSRTEFETRSREAGTLVSDSSGNMDMEASRRELSSKRSNLQNSDAYRRTHNSGGNR